ncbi:hypothetical protein Taro_034961 [Colocasia esculenta]|uniref:Uncharacterized protein n=1 Tax=Colocasia esculenta TaxID=4460 RepID=A0A843W2D5_COLES|nr:hypothetical protein [Colocasia esculenta]
MAESVVSFVVQRVGDLLVDEAVFLYNVPDEAEWVRRELERMQCFLEDADAKRKRDKMVNKWVKDIRDAAYEAEDLVESFALHGHLLWGRGGFITRVARRFVCLPCALATRHRFGEEIRLLKAKILEIADSRSRYGIQSLRADGGGDNTNRSAYVDETVQQRRRVALHADDSGVVGMDDAKQDILKLLRDDGVKRRAVVSIVGMGGLGKTTLAKKVYNTFTIHTRAPFVCVEWFNISQQYRAVELLQNLVKKFAGVGGEAAGKMSREELEEELHNSLKGRRYLIIMDDVWDNNVWNILNAHLPDDVNGSRVLITTRSIDVARAADPGTTPYELRFLNEQESWELFCRKVFPHQDVRTACPAALQEMGKQISKKCGGLPLALVVLGGMLSRKPKSAAVWGKLADTIGWQNSEEGQLCLEILALSYNDLSPQLKWCFLYLGSFPEDYLINVEKLTRLWIAEGFVVRREGETLEESAEDYLEELIQRCLVQVAERSSYGGVSKCRIHDLLHDLSIGEAKEVDFIECHRNANLASTTWSSSVRRLSLHTGMETYLSEGHPTPKLRTLLGFNFGITSTDLPVERLKLLRVVDLEQAPLKILPEAIGDAVHLRYLGLRGTQIKFLPASIGKLCHLQILDAASTGVIKVPNSLWRITSLRHIFLPPRVQPQIALGSLRDLHVLEAPEAGRWIDDGLAGLTNLQKLGIEKISESHNEALSSSLERLSRLRRLELAGTLIPRNALTLSNHHQLYVLLLFGLLGKPPQPYSSSQLPSSLTQISLFGTRLDQDPLALLEWLPELRILILQKDSYVGKEMVCSPGGFLRLEVLRMEYLEELEKWGVGDGAMVCLKSLSIRGCRKLEVLSQELQNMHALQELTIANMNDDFNLRVRKGDGEDWPKIQHVSSININNTLIH